ncbi:MAG TPA: hypothetical protein PLZ50_11715, partial [Rubrivivax sp.]|nr:hypothetical protein [Rubrivivax sp.]
DCSPSRKVVSKMMSLSVMVGVFAEGVCQAAWESTKTARCFALAGRRSENWVVVWTCVRSAHPRLG